MKSFSEEQTKHISKLARIPLSPDELSNLADGFSQTIAVVERLRELDTKGILPLHNVTELHSVFRQDVVDEGLMLSQKEALANAPSTYKGFFAVPHVFESRT